MGAVDRAPVALTVKGLDLARRLDAEVVAPLIAERLPGLVHARGIVGEGSEVQGYDDEMSTDHMWGAKSFVFVRGRMLVWSVSEALERTWPSELAGYPVLAPRVVDIDEGFRAWLPFDPTGEVTTQDWLATTSQQLLEVTGGEVFHDGDGTVTTIRQRLAWYPDDVWRWLLAAGWNRVGQELQLVGRTGMVGDDLGSRVVAARVARDLMRLCFLVERRYAPYAKWLGTAFTRLDAGRTVGEVLTDALAAAAWEPRAESLARAAEMVALLQLDLGLHERIDVSPRPYFTRPFPVVPADALAAALVDGITDPVLRGATRIVGNVDLVTDSVDVAGDHTWGRLHASWFTPKS